MLKPEINLSELNTKEEIKVVFQSPDQKASEPVKIFYNDNGLNYYTFCDKKDITICVEVENILYRVFRRNQTEGIRQMEAGTLLRSIAHYCDEKYTAYIKRKHVILAVNASLFGAIGRLDEFKEINKSNKKNIAEISR